MYVPKGKWSWCRIIFFYQLECCSRNRLFWQRIRRLLTAAKSTSCKAGFAAFAKRCTLQKHHDSTESKSANQGWANLKYPETMVLLRDIFHLQLGKTIQMPVAAASPEPALFCSGCLPEECVEASKPSQSCRDLDGISYFYDSLAASAARNYANLIMPDRLRCGWGRLNWQPTWSGAGNFV